MRILGIESSCDDTSVALIEHTDDGFMIHAQKTASQIDIHAKYGGVVPEIAARAHAEAITPVIEEVMKGQEKPDVIAVTAGPGLITGLLVGVEAAKMLSYLWKVPVVAVNHIDGHIHSVELDNSQQTTDNSRPLSVDRSLLASKQILFPALCLIVSGGHTELIVMKNHGVYERVGKTLDDAAGECFDKVGKLVGLAYPGGPKISKLAANGKTDAINFPRPMMDRDNLDFSFAGLKTAALYWLQDHAIKKENGMFELSGEITTEDFCASFEQAITDVLVEKTMKAMKKYESKSILLAGGVSANRKLRESLTDAIQKKGDDIPLLIPELQFCTDNAAMIAVAGYYKAKQGLFTPWQEVKADPNWRIA